VHGPPAMKRPQNVLGSYMIASCRRQRDVQEKAQVGGETQAEL